VGSLFFQDKEMFAGLFDGVGSDGNTYLYDISVPGRMALFNSDSHSMVIDSSGIHFDAVACSMTFNVNIGRFAGQVDSYANPGGSSGGGGSSGATFNKRAIHTPTKRRQSNLPVTVDVLNQCGQGVTTTFPMLFSGSTTNWGPLVTWIGRLWGAFVSVELFEAATLVAGIALGPEVIAFIAACVVIFH
jgi:hypothetical protein